MTKIIITLFLMAISTLAVSQGCSDAGFCTLGNLNPLHQKQGKQKLTVGITNGIGDENVYVFTPSLKYDYKINTNWEVQAKLTGNYASGNLGSALGLGDLFINASHSLKSSTNRKTNILIGAKIPLNNSNLKANNKSLPMQYQSSLGTFDIIVGVSTIKEKWLIATAMQIPLIQHNANMFLPSSFGNSNALKYPPSYSLNRKADVLLKANYEIYKAKHSNYNIGLLGIYHLSNDSYKNPSISSQNVEIVGSKGLTLNATFAASFELSKKLNLGFLAGSPLIVRKIRPDGLTRSFSISTELIFNL